MSRCGACGYQFPCDWLYAWEGLYVCKSCLGSLQAYRRNIDAAKTVAGVAQDKAVTPPGEEKEENMSRSRGWKDNLRWFCIFFVLYLLHGSILVASFKLGWRADLPHEYEPGLSLASGHETIVFLFWWWLLTPITVWLTLVWVLVWHGLIWHILVPGGSLLFRGLGWCYDCVIGGLEHWLSGHAAG